MATAIPGTLKVVSVFSTTASSCDSEICENVNVDAKKARPINK
jgi:hypothetical protein